MKNSLYQIFLVASFFIQSLIVSATPIFLQGKLGLENVDFKWQLAAKNGNQEKSSRIQLSNANFLGIGGKIETCFYSPYFLFLEGNIGCLLDGNFSEKLQEKTSLSLFKTIFFIQSYRNKNSPDKGVFCRFNIGLGSSAFCSSCYGTLVPMIGWGTRFFSFRLWHPSRLIFDDLPKQNSSTFTSRLKKTSDFCASDIYQQRFTSIWFGGKWKWQAFPAYLITPLEISFFCHLAKWQGRRNSQTLLTPFDRFHRSGKNAKGWTGKISLIPYQEECSSLSIDLFYEDFWIEKKMRTCFLWQSCFKSEVDLRTLGLELTLQKRF